MYHRNAIQRKHRSVRPREGLLRAGRLSPAGLQRRAHQRRQHRMHVPGLALRGREGRQRIGVRPQHSLHLVGYAANIVRRIEV